MRDFFRHGKFERSCAAKKPVSSRSRKAFERREIRLDQMKLRLNFEVPHGPLATRRLNAVSPKSYNASGFQR